MQVVILAGGLGTRIAEETHVIPKPMINIGEMPIIWHIMKIYSHYGHNDFIICCGYKSSVIKTFFLNYRDYASDLRVSLSDGKVEYFSKAEESWTVSLFETGLDTQTGGRLLAVKDYLDDNFLLTYGDGVADVDINALIDCHSSSYSEVTLTAVQPEGRYGALDIDGDVVKVFNEKPVGDGGWVNGGFMVCNKSIIDLISGPQSILEDVPLNTLSKNGLLTAYKHRGFWASMDTKRDHLKLNKIWEDGAAKWKIW